MTVWPEKIKKIPTQARAIKRVQNILSVSQLIIEEQGVDAFTTTTLAKQAGLPIGSIYQYFESREDILQHIYNNAYSEVLEKVKRLFDDIEGGINFEVLNQKIINSFWHEAKNHKSFNKLTRWANSSSTIWETTALDKSEIPILVEKSLLAANIELPETRKDGFIKTISTVISVLIDQAIENEEQAELLIEELRVIVNAYVKTLT
ncbi:TetR/AcrR family transcriptional regulator [Kordiimonas sp. SCSIO 12610]|uniref:TetR/AcrR family transcriptional regulator n=1 Tax=Kordiimonas sp. SCSIO 12610 TaxID=2829597 RepID=UPI002109E1CA|nr:TetR/AcrR family transcriptional regulator [Kordiimonas sp. SCSIO 12610]UTW55462.1 TetR/AcrR family transcriptional regulator [Kordiimonas sp. SCSIO 12610]